MAKRTGAKRDGAKERRWRRAMTRFRRSGKKERVQRAQMLVGQKQPPGQ
jgi:hypothetical protein